MIPAKNDWETDHLVDAFCSITRKDLEKNQEIVVEDTRNKAKKLFNPPNDFTMSIIYSMVADRNFDPNAYKIFPVRRRF